ncbi:MAG: hypothetical protein A2297_06970 [Elusimicrobia bacterium RIFOXYB2_FULL_48_7]|nr:MAG: hypothetical protein A2297_06970 [Elusimicrobia bacterium RIFOXYB2_FULL_48_7]
MNILFLTHSFPYPIDEGIKLMAYNLIKELSARHKVSLLSLIESEAENKHALELKRYCQKVETVHHVLPRSPKQRLFNTLFQKEPFNILQFYSLDFAVKLKQMLNEEKYDLVHFNFMNTTFYRNDIPEDMPCVFCSYDAMSMHFFRNISAEKSAMKKFYLRNQWKKLERYEIAMLPRFNRTVVVSPVDRDWFLDLFKGIQKKPDISIVPIGVDPDYFKPVFMEDDYPSVIFRGIMGFLPNIDAALYFQKEIFPAISREIPETKYYIVGKNPTEEVRAASNSRKVVVTGYVDDIRPYIAKATVNVCPMRVGTGMKYKIIESMALGTPTVATAFSCAGIPELKHGENIMIADTPEEFARSVVMLLKDKNLRLKLSENGRKMVSANYTWKKVAEKFENIYQEIVN